MDWRSKIEGLLAKAQDRATTPEEAEAIHEKIAYLMAKYGIEDAQVRSERITKEGAVSEKFTIFGPYADRKVDLLTVIVGTLGGIGVHTSKLKIQVFAFKEDLERIKMLYYSLLAQLHIEVSMVEIPIDENKKSFKNSWMFGFIVTVRNRLERAVNKVKEETSGAELVLINRNNRVDEALREEFPHTQRTHRTSSFTSDAGYSAGVTAGQQADIGHGKLGGSRHRITT